MGTARKKLQNSNDSPRANHGDARTKAGKRKLGRAWNSAFDKETLDTCRKRVQL